MQRRIRPHVKTAAAMRAKAPTSTPPGASRALRVCVGCDERCVCASVYVCTMEESGPWKSSTCCERERGRMPPFIDIERSNKLSGQLRHFMETDWHVRARTRICQCASGNAKGASAGKSIARVLVRAPLFAADGATDWLAT